MLSPARKAARKREERYRDSHREVLRRRRNARYRAQVLGLPKTETVRAEKMK